MPGRKTFPHPNRKNPMRATDFEFRYRFWFIFLLFWVAFSAYWIDHRGAGVSLVRLFGPVSDTAVHAVFGVAAFLAGIAPWCGRGRPPISRASGSTTPTCAPKGWWRTAPIA